MKKIFLPVLTLIGFCAGAQNVGIGNANPSSKLEIGNNSSLRPSIGIIDSTTNGLGTVRFKNSVRTNRFMELEGWTFSTFARDNYLDIKSDSGILATFRGDGNFGIGTISPTERLHVNGNMNLTGTIKVNGNAGTAGQVLTSNGTNDPTWETMRSNYPDNMRVMIPIERTIIPFKLERNLLLNPPVYNTSAGLITVADSTITFNETGLYELEGKLHFLPGNVSLFAPDVLPVGSMRIFADYGGGVTASYMQIYQQVPKRNAITYSQVIPFSFKSHITAGTVFRFPVNIFAYDGNTCCDQVEVYEGYISILKVD